MIAPNRAQLAASSRTNVAGPIGPDISNPYYPEVTRGIEDAASTVGWRVVLCNTDRDMEKTTTYLDTPRRRGRRPRTSSGSGTDGSPSSAARTRPVPCRTGSPLTTVAIPSYEIGHRAMGILLAEDRARRSVTRQRLSSLWRP